MGFFTGQRVQSLQSTGGDLEQRFGGRVDLGKCHGPVKHQPENFMITNIGLLRFTDKGLQSVKDSTKRAAAAKESGKKLGVNMRDIFWTTGEYDLVCVLEADNESALAAFALAVAAQGNVRVQTLRAYSAGEMDTILAKLP
jgi:uncharacterized protein with GYD domain